MMLSRLNVIVCLLMLASCASLEKAGDEVGSEGLSRDELANATYRSEWTKSGNVSLVNGEYSESAAASSATKTRVKLTDKIDYGKLDGQPVAAVVLITDPGGSGTFYELAVVVNKDGKPVNVASTYLGDRVKIKSISIEDDEILLDMVSHGPDDPLCCPTQRVLKRFGLQGNRLVKTSSGAEIIGLSWRWQQTLMNNGDTFVPKDPNKYTLMLKPDGQAAVRADCNYGNGTYRIKDSRITVEIMAMTMAACPPGSLSDQYVKNLNGAAGYFMAGEALYIDLKYDSGTMKFSR